MPGVVGDVAKAVAELRGMDEDEVSFLFQLFLFLMVLFNNLSNNLNPEGLGWNS